MENQISQRKTCPSATVSTTNLTWTALGSNLACMVSGWWLYELCTALYFYDSLKIRYVVSLHGVRYNVQF
jgi:hypothetical protein